MQRKHNAAIVSNARVLRKNMTKEERHLWYDFLRTYPVRFSRQKVLGRYIADFYSAEAKLVVELDGSEHYFDAGMKYDQERTVFLAGYGLLILRFSNRQIHEEFAAVCEQIHSEAQRRINR